MAWCKLKQIALLLSIIMFANSVQAFEIIKKDARQKEAQYIHKVHKNEEKEKLGRKKENYKPSGFMTVEEYNELSKYTEEPVEPEVKKVRDSELKYVPEPTYKIVRYNDPPGSPELNITKKFYQLHQYNGQGVVAPDYSMIVYPVVYYYSSSDSTASDLFVIKLPQEGSPLSKIKNAKTSDRLPDPIISTEKSVDNDTAFRTLTPVDFSADGHQLLAKEKIGSSQDGIWKTNAIVYDFDTNTSYNLVEVRDAIAYYWKENKNLNLDECRWDIYPLGFLQDEPGRIAVNAYGYTGDLPVNLGIWSVDIHGEQSRLIAFDQKEVNFSINGFKLIQDGVVARTIVEKEQKALKKADKRDARQAKRQEKAAYREMNREYRATIKDMNWYYKQDMKDLKKINSMKGSTTFEDLPAAFKEYKAKELQKDIKHIEKQIKKEEKQLEKLENKLNDELSD